MKPLLIFTEQKDGTISITKEELKRILDEVYMQAREDATSYIRTMPEPERKECEEREQGLCPFYAS